MLTELQQKAYDVLMRRQNLFLSGPGGCGKTFLIRHFYEKNKDKMNIAVTSTTGTSAVLIGGTTINSYLGIMLGKGTVEQLHELVKKRHKIMKWRKLDTLIIDEISMMDADLFDKLDKLAKIIRRNDKPFGGIQIFGSGDFCQLPCVKSDKFCFDAEEWNNVMTNTILLNENKRQMDDKFQQMLNEIRYGIITEETKMTLNNCIDKDVKNGEIEPTKLFSRNNEVAKTNEKEIGKLVGEERMYKMEIKQRTNETIDINKYTMLEMNLKLVKGCQVILLRNMNITDGLVNGSRGIVIGFDDFPIVKFMNGEIEKIGPYTSTIEMDERVVAEITQVPLKLGYAISIHKSQGMTIDCAELELKNVFESGQAYVALSRIKSIEGLSIKSINYRNIYTNGKVIDFYKKHIKK